MAEMQAQWQLVNMIGSALEGATSTDHIWRVAEVEFGLQKLGSGSYGAVFRHPTNYDLVIKIGRDTMDDGWLDYAAFCMQNPGAPELLVVHDVRVFTKCYIAVMEKLEHPGYDFSKYADIAYWRVGERLTPALQKLLDTCGVFTDLHDGNVMLRGDTVVVTDPYSTGSGLHKSYLTANGRIDVTRHTAVQEPNIKIRDANELMYLRNKQITKGFIAGGMGLIAGIPGCNKNWVEQRWNFPNVGQHVFVQVKKRDEPSYAKPIPRERALVVKDGTPASIRAEKEDRMLRVRSKHDHTAYVQGVQRSLLPQQRSRWLQAARDAIAERIARAFDRQFADAVWGRKVAPRLLVGDTSKQDAVAA